MGSYSEEVVTQLPKLNYNYENIHVLTAQICANSTNIQHHIKQWEPLQKYRIGMISNIKLLA